MGASTTSSQTDFLNMTIFFMLKVTKEKKKPDSKDKITDFAVEFQRFCVSQRIVFVYYQYFSKNKFLVSW